MAETLGYPPMLGIDDFGIQLDKERQLQLKNHLPKFNQVFLTSPTELDGDLFGETPLSLFLVNKGGVMPDCVR
jgi:recombinational DNA repair ATPase RecF